MSEKYVKEKLREMFETTIDGGLKYEGSYISPEYYNLFCKAAANDSLYKVLNNNVCMFNCSYNDSDAVMILFSIPINSNETSSKNIAERVMEIIAKIEESFITTEYINSEEVKEDKFVYITVVKKVSEK